MTTNVLTNEVIIAYSTNPYITLSSNDTITNETITNETISIDVATTKEVNTMYNNLSNRIDQSEESQIILIIVIAIIFIIALARDRKK